ncbi:hypothetical protein Tco_0717153 [Tanacetum coccineum]
MIARHQFIGRAANGNVSDEHVGPSNALAQGLWDYVKQCSLSAKDGFVWICSGERRTDGSHGNLHSQFNSLGQGGYNKYHLKWKLIDGDAARMIQLGVTDALSIVAFYRITECKCHKSPGKIRAQLRERACS